MNSFAVVFKNLRIEHNLTQSELSDKLGIAKSAVSMYENGNRQPNFETLELIADFFNVDLNYLLGRDPSHGKTASMHTISTIAAHHDNEDWTDEELLEIKKFKEFVKMKRNK